MSTELGIQNFIEPSGLVAISTDCLGHFLRKVSYEGNRLSLHWTYSRHLKHEPLHDLVSTDDIGWH